MLSVLVSGANLMGVKWWCLESGYFKHLGSQGLVQGRPDRVLYWLLGAVWDVWLQQGSQGGLGPVGAHELPVGFSCAVVWCF